MIKDLPHWIDITFLLATLFSITLFYFSNGKPKLITLIIIVWSIIQSYLAYDGFYQIKETIPPRYMLVFAPVGLFIIYGLLPKQLAWIYTNRNLKISTFLHTVRIPVEIVLLYLYYYKMVPELMTFEGANFDILAGLTAPILGLLFIKSKLNSKVLLIWNVLGLILILTVLTIGILTGELPIQQFAFNQPNVAINYFPYILLPVTIVPLVVYTHITDILKLKNGSKSTAITK